MMQEDKKYEEFDLMFRSAFEDAQEKVPESVWNAVSSRISARRRIVAFTSWASAGVIAAAAALALIFTVGRTSGSAPLQEVRAIQQDMVAMVETPQEVEEQMEEHASAPARRRSTGAAPSSAVSEPLHVTEEPAVQAQDPVQEAAASSSGNARTTDEGGKWADAFASMMAEDARAQRASGNRLAVSAGGNMASTDPDRTTAGDKVMAAQRAEGYVPSQTGITENSVSQYGIPLSLGISAAWHFTDRWYVSTGLEWTLLSRTFQGVYDQVTAGKLDFSLSTDITHVQHYIGIPVSVGYTLFNTPDVNLYVYGTAEAEKCVSNRYLMKKGEETIRYGSPVKGFQYSAGAGIGAEFRLSDHVGLYVDPSFRYYFDCNQPKNLRTDKKYMLDFSAGFRFNF